MRIYLFLFFMVGVSILWLWFLFFITRKLTGAKVIAVIIVALVGLVVFFGIKYYSFYLYDPKSFYIIPAHKLTYGGVRLFDFIYFSFVTITTLGYGDIIPLHTLTKILTILEVLMGVSFVGLILGRIVIKRES